MLLILNLAADAMMRLWQVGEIYVKFGMRYFLSKKSKFSNFAGLSKLLNTLSKSFNIGTQMTQMCRPKNRLLNNVETLNVIETNKGNDNSEVTLHST